MTREIDGDTATDAEVDMLALYAYFLAMSIERT